MRTYQDFAHTATAVLPTQKNNKMKNSTIALMGVTGALMIAEMSIHNILFGGFMIAGAIAVALPKQTQALLTNFEKIQRKYGVNLYAVLFTLLAVVCVLDFAAAPAHAQFFQRAETWMSGVFDNAGGNGQTATVVALFFNVLRALFLLYLGVSIVRIIQAARNDEDWQSLVRTPLIIVVAVFVADLITGLIVNT